jgi:hypothetical protein
MFTLLRSYFASRRLARKARLVQLAKQADEVLIGGKLSPDTRRLLQLKRDDLESRIRDQVPHWLPAFL